MDWDWTLLQNQENLQLGEELFNTDTPGLALSVNSALTWQEGSGWPGCALNKSFICRSWETGLFFVYFLAGAVD